MSTSTLCEGGKSEKERRDNYVVGIGCGSKRKNKKRKAMPNPGEDGYMTPTQLRNARKRRAKKNRRRSAADLGSSTSSVMAQQPKGKKREKVDADALMDPSSKFIKNPEGAPMIQVARQFFGTKLPTKSKFKVHLGRTEGWRTVSKLAVRRDARGKVVIGLFLPKSHTIISGSDCVAHHPSINSAVCCITKICNLHNIAPFDEETGRGYLRYLALSVERSTKKVQVAIVWNSKPYGAEEEDTASNDDGKRMLDKFIREIRCEGGNSNKKKCRRGRKGKDETENDRKRDGSDSKQFELHSLYVHYNSTWRHSNAIFNINVEISKSWQRMYGPSYVEERLKLEGQDHTVGLRFPPYVFRQANICAFTRIVAAIRRRLKQFNEDHSAPGNEYLASVAELYGGVGTIGLNLCDLISSLVSSDSNPNNASCFRGSASLLPEYIQQRVSYIPKNATAMMKDNGWLNRADVLIVDPPRRGFEEPVLSALTGLAPSSGPKLLVYVSCGFRAFTRDCDAMLESKNWVLEHSEGHILFPGSDAIETLAYFVRT